MSKSVSLLASVAVMRRVNANLQSSFGEEVVNPQSEFARGAVTAAFQVERIKNWGGLPNLEKTMNFMELCLKTVIQSKEYISKEMLFDFDDTIRSVEYAIERYNQLSK